MNLRIYCIRRIYRIFSLVCLCLALGLCLSCSQEPKEPDFRNIRWGMSVEEVKAAEGLPVALEKPHDEPEQYFVEYQNVEYLGKNSTLRYFFHQNECYLAVYLYYNADRATYDHVLAEYVKLHGPGKRLRETDKVISYSWDWENIFNYLSYLYNRENNIVMVRFLALDYAPAEAFLRTGAKYYQA